MSRCGRVCFRACWRRWSATSARVRKACGSSRSGASFFRRTARKFAALDCFFAARRTAQPHWRGGRPRPLDLFDLKGALEAIGLGEVQFCVVGERPEFASRRKFSWRGRNCGFAGQLASAQSVRRGAPVFVAEIDLPNDIESATSARKFRELQRFPSVTRDIAMIAPERSEPRGNSRRDRRRDGNRCSRRSSCSISSAERMPRISARDENRSRIH